MAATVLYASFVIRSRLLAALTAVLLLCLQPGFGKQEPTTSACTEELDVLVLGAGIAGVKAAATLVEGGLQKVVVLEQSHRIGGRMWNTEWEGQTIELGANWIEGVPQNENPIWAIAQEIGLRGNYTMQEGSPVEPNLYDSAGRVHKTEAAVLHRRLSAALTGAMSISCKRHRKDLGDITLREALLEAGWPSMQHQTPLERTLEFFVVDWDFEVPPENMSLFNYFDVGKPGSWREACGQSSRPKHTRRAHTAARMGMLDGFAWEAPRYLVTDARGYAAVAEHVAKSFLGVSASGEPQLAGSGEACGRPHVLFNKAVRAIHYGAAATGGVRVETADGQVYAAKRCIVTFSSGVVNTAVKHSELFYPALPTWKAHAFAKADLGVYTKIFVRYSKRFWDDADYVLFADATRRGYYAVWQDMESHGKFFPIHANILMVTLVQRDSWRVELQPASETVAELQAALREMYGPDVPEPIDILIPKWHSSQFFRGSWSNIAIGTTAKDFDAMQRPVGGGLYFAGEATDAAFNGFVLGGYNSGEVVANNVLKDFESEQRMLGLRASAFWAVPDGLFRYRIGGAVMSPALIMILAGVVFFLVSVLHFFDLRSNLRLLGARARQRGVLGSPLLPEPSRGCEPPVA